MAFVPVQNAARFELVYTHNSVIVENVFHLESVNSTWTNSDLTAAATTFKSWWDNQMKAKCSTGTVLTKIIGTALTTQVSPKIEYVTGLPLTGTGTGTPLPGNVTVAVKWVTGNRGRSARGRTYHVGLCEEQVTGNQLDESFYTALLSSYENLISGIFDVGVTMRVVSLWHNKVQRESGVTYVINGVSINPTIDTQRRRLE